MALLLVSVKGTSPGSRSCFLLAAPAGRLGWEACPRGDWKGWRNVKNEFRLLPLGVPTALGHSRGSHVRLGKRGMLRLSGAGAPSYAGGAASHGRGRGDAKPRHPNRLTNTVFCRRLRTVMADGRLVPPGRKFSAFLFVGRGRSRWANAEPFGPSGLFPFAGDLPTGPEIGQVGSADNGWWPRAVG